MPIPPLGTLATASFGAYILHPAIVVALQAGIVSLALPALIKLPSYRWLERLWPFGSPNYPAKCRICGRSWAQVDVRVGSFASVSPLSGCFRSSPISGPRQGPSACLKRAPKGDSFTAANSCGRPRGVREVLDPSWLWPDGLFDVPRRANHLILSSPFRKNISVFPKPKSALYTCRPVPLGGALRNVTNAGRDAVDADGAGDDSAFRRTEKLCGPDAPTLASSSWKTNPRATVARKPGHRGEREGNR